MKKLLFVMDSFPLGGIAKAQLALFNALEGKYEIDFLLMRQEGLLLPLIPKSVRLLNEPLEIAFRNPHPANAFKALKELSFGKWLKWCTFSLTCSLGRLRGGLHGQINAMDVWLGKNTPAIKKHYDAAIAFQGGRCIYYIAEQIDADVKIGFVHSNYSVNETDFMLKPSDSIYFPQMDYIATISQVCLESLWKEFPALKEKCLVIENICSPKMINTMAAKGESYTDGFKGVRLASMGRFDIQIKGMDMAVEVCRILKQKGVSFRWYWLGEGDQRPQLEKMIKDAGVGDVFILLGAKTNPYPYIKDADIYVQPSRIEGKSVALDEVKALARPVVVTCFGSVYDQFTDKQNALISEMNAQSVADNIIKLIEDNALAESLHQNLLNEKVGNEEQAEVFTSLLTKKRV